MFAVAAALAVAAVPAPARADPADAGAAPPRAGEARDGGPAPDADRDVVEHLDELQRLELLEHLGLLDPSGDDDAPLPDGGKPAP